MKRNNRHNIMFHCIIKIFKQGVDDLINFCLYYCLYPYIFKHLSKKSIQILTVKPSCGCTTPDWSKKEIKPGKEGFIVAEYNPRGRPGIFRKSLSVVTSDNKRSVIFIKGKVSR